MRTLNYGQLSHAIKIIELAAKESRDYRAKTTQAEFNDGLSVLMELVGDQLERSNNDGEITEIQFEDMDYDLDQVEKMINPNSYLHKK